MNRAGGACLLKELLQGPFRLAECGRKTLNSGAASGRRLGEFLSIYLHPGFPGVLDKPNRRTTGPFFRNQTITTDCSRNSSTPQTVTYFYIATWLAVLLYSSRFATRNPSSKASRSLRLVLRPPPQSQSLNKTNQSIWGGNGASRKKQPTQQPSPRVLNRHLRIRSFVHQQSPQLKKHTSSSSCLPTSSASASGCSSRSTRSR